MVTINRLHYERPKISHPPSEYQIPTKFQSYISTNPYPELSLEKNVEIIQQNGSIFIKANGEVKAKLEAGQSVSLNIGGERITIIVNEAGELTISGNAKLEVLKGKDGYYITSDAGASIKISSNGKLKIKIDNYEMEIGGKIYAEALAEAKLELGKATARKGDEIISKAGAYGALIAQANIGTELSASISSEDGSVAGSLNLSKGLGPGIAAGYKTSTVINTSSWDVKFSTFAELDIGLISEIGIAVNIEGETNISQDISNIREELKKYVQEEENKEIKKSQESQKSQEDRQTIKQRILQNIPGWNTKLHQIEQTIKRKTSNVIKGFIPKILERISNRTIANMIGGAIGWVTEKIISILWPTINSAVNEIKPTDILK